MKIIISPAKKMNKDIEYIDAKNKPVFLKETKQLLRYLKLLQPNQIKEMLQCSDTIANNAFKMYQQMSLKEVGCPALLAYNGIQYQYMAPQIFYDEYYEYAEEHVRIISGFYGILRPFDGVVPYRLELNNKFVTPFCRSLYDFWKDKIYQELVKAENFILDLASAQCSKVIKQYVTGDIQFVKCYFKEETTDGYREKGVYVKMARGEMVRYLTEIHASTIEEVITFNRLGYRFQEALSDKQNLVFTRISKKI